MTDSPSVPPDQEASRRFRRLLSRAEEEEQALQDELQANLPSGSLPPPSTEDGVETIPVDIEETGPSASPDFETLPLDKDQGGTWSLPPRPDPSSEEETQPIRLPDPNLPPANQPAATSKPSIAAQDQPLPRRVDEIDTDATRVSPTAYRSSPRTVQPAMPSRSGVPPRPPNIPPPTARRTPLPAAPARSGNRALGCLVRLVVVTLFVVVITGLCGVSYVVLRYLQIRAGLPNVAELREKASQFETTRILDRNGNVLYEILDPNAGRRTYVPLNKISPYLVAATIATEDKEFYNHPGFDIIAILRAFLQNYQGGGEIVSGASTITQQLARTLLFTPEERSQRTYDRKIREAVLAAEITRIYSKDIILELYLNENYYGNLAYGVEAAAQTYFGTSSGSLTLGQAAFLAGLPQAPAVYDVHANREVTLKRQEDVLVLMYEMSQEKGCIVVSNSPQPVCLDPVSAATAANELNNYDFHRPEVQIRYPHWVTYIRTLLEAQYDPQTIYRSGFNVYTTLDPGLQEMAERIVKERVAGLQGNHATDGALVAIRPATGEILALVGSADFYNEAIAGQVNMAVSPRQPGSSIKPLTYAAAFEKGWTPSTLIWDVPSEFTPSGRQDDPSPLYRPINYDDRFHGPVTVRYALANSYNLPAVKTLLYIGIYDDPNTVNQDGFLAFARRMGISTLTRPDYGLSLTLGGGDVTLLELTSAYSIFANGGRRAQPVAITRIEDFNGELVYQYQQSPGEQTIRPEHAYLISSILSDNEARSSAFGRNSVLNLPFQTAVKTGTTNDFRDNWTLGYTPDLAVGVWVGNADYTPMQNTSGVTGAAPIWAEFMQSAIQQITGNNPTPFTRPASVVEKVICDISGTLPSQWCPTQRTEIFAADQPPLSAEEDLWQKIEVDTWTGLRASNQCSDFKEERFVINVSDEFARKWIRRDPAGNAWADNMGFEQPITFAPDRQCQSDDPQPLLAFGAPKNSDVIFTSPLEIFAQADATQNFDFWRLEYGLGDEPIDWIELERSGTPIRQVDNIYTWDLIDIPTGLVTLRLYLSSTEDTHAELRAHIYIQVPTPTVTPSPTPTVTPTPTITPTPTPSPSPTVTPHLPKATLTFTPTPPGGEPPPDEASPTPIIVVP